MKDRPAVVAVSGVKNSGKTTLIIEMLPYLTEKGLRVAVIKHDGHSFEPDPVCPDTGRYLAGGACGSAIYDQEKFQIIKEQSIAVENLIDQFSDVDLILIEGLKFSAWPKLEVVRSDNSSGPVCDPATLLALVTDLPIEYFGVKMIPLGNAEAAARILLRYMEEEFPVD